MTSDIPEETKREIAEAIFTERKIEAIKIYREATGQGLAESKVFIEQLTDELREKSPEQFKPLSSGSAAGCSSSVLLFLGVAGTVTAIATTFFG